MCQSFPNKHKEGEHRPEIPELFDDLTEDFPSLLENKTGKGIFWTEPKLHSLKVMFVVKYLHMLISANIRALEWKSNKTLVNVDLMKLSEHRNI